MEYSPVAINEVLAYSFLRKYKDSSDSTGNASGYPTNRFFVELVNTLTESAGTGASTSNGPSTSRTPTRTPAHWSSTTGRWWSPRTTRSTAPTRRPGNC